MKTRNRKLIYLLLLVLLLGMLALLFIGVSLLNAGFSIINVSALGLSAGQIEITPLNETSVTSSPTPFQPLPTNTPTATATPTSTPTSTSTPTPLPTSTPRPTDTPVPTALPADGLPSSASVEGVVGYRQSHNLTCESRSAVDWARYFDVSIDEMEFQAALPISDNPDYGFVGNYDDPLGSIPPASYGVHAGPVANLLREYGLSATAVKDYPFQKIRRMIAKGKPVIVWVIGNVWEGWPVEYTASDGSVVTVAHYEHTAIIVGYDEYGVTVVDNDLVYWRSTADFLDSWGVLGNMAIIAK